MNICIQIQGNIRFGFYSLQNHQIPKIRIALRVAVLILQEQLAHNACFPGITVRSMRGCPADPDAHLAAGVAPEDGAVLHQRHLLSQSGCSNGCTHPGQSAADYRNVIVN
ncbi:hypothetical protein D3C73_840060 [compost metagenome]